MRRRPSPTAAPSRLIGCLAAGLIGGSTGCGSNTTDSFVSDAVVCTPDFDAYSEDPGTIDSETPIAIPIDSALWQDTATADTAKRRWGLELRLQSTPATAAAGLNISMRVDSESAPIANVPFSQSVAIGGTPEWVRIRFAEVVHQSAGQAASLAVGAWSATASYAWLQGGDGRFLYRYIDCH